MSAYMHNEYGAGVTVLALQVSYTDGFGALETLWSNPTAKVIP